MIHTALVVIQSLSQFVIACGVLYIVARSSTTPRSVTVPLPARNGGIGAHVSPGPIATPAPPDPVIAGPPRVRGDAVRDWLTHYTRGRHTWAEAVQEFYRRQ